MTKTEQLAELNEQVRQLRDQAEANPADQELAQSLASKGIEIALARQIHGNVLDFERRQREAVEAETAPAPATGPKPYTDRYRAIAARDSVAAALYRQLNAMAIAAEENSEPLPPDLPGAA